MLVAVPLIAIAVAVVLAPSLSASSTALPRATTDRADDRSGNQIHLMYVLPSDAGDRSLDTDGTIAASVRNWQTWLRSQTSGRGLFVDTSGGELDITFHRLPQTDAAYAARGVFIRDAIEADLHAAGFNAAGKIYSVYYDGSSTAACGGGPWPPALPGNVGAVYTRATFGAGQLCYIPSRSLAGIQYMDYAIIHEAFHAMGIVGTCAPNHTRSGHVSDSPTDLMYAGDQGWVPSVLDLGRNDYFEAPVAGCVDLADSPYFGATESAPPPPGGGGGGGGGGGTPSKVKLTVGVSGPGRVSSSPAGISCPGKCSATFASGKAVVLRPAPANGAKLVRWSGACKGAKACRVTLDGPRSVKALFKR